MKLRRRFFAGIHVNAVIKKLMLFYFVFWSGIGLITPVFAVFLTEQIKGGGAEVAGFAVAVYLASKSLFQIPVARYLDLHRGERDDYQTAILGSIIVGLSPFLYIGALLPWHIYLIQALYGFGNALTLVSGDSIYTRHLDKDEVAFEWSVYYTVIDLGGAIAAGIGGLVATVLGFKPLFVLAGLVTSSSVFVLLALSKYLKK